MVNRSIKILLVLIAVFIALTVFVLELTSDKKEYVTDPVIAHIPLRADLDFPDEPILNRTVDIIYTLNPAVDIKVNVSEGLILPEGIVFVENNLPAGQITLKKGKKYRYSAKIKVIKPGRLTIYASPGVYADLGVYYEGFLATVGVQKVFKATIPITMPPLIEKITKQQQDELAAVAKNWLREYGAQEYEKEVFNCSKISENLNLNISCYGCELRYYSDSVLYDSYYSVIEKNFNTNKTKVRNVYHWAYQTPTSYQRKPVCEEIAMKEGDKL